MRRIFVSGFRRRIFVSGSFGFGLRFASPLPRAAADPECLPRLCSTGALGVRLGALCSAVGSAALGVGEALVGPAACRSLLLVHVDRADGGDFEHLAHGVGQTDAPREGVGFPDVRTGEGAFCKLLDLGSWTP
jgi:hypothetical protein